MTKNTSFSPGKEAESSNRCSSQEKKRIKQLCLAPGNATDHLGLLNVRHLRPRRGVLAAEPVPGHQLHRVAAAAAAVPAPTTSPFLSQAPSASLSLCQGSSSTLH